jgi:hypothetical protein
MVLIVAREDAEVVRAVIEAERSCVGLLGVMGMNWLRLVELMLLGYSRYFFFFESFSNNFEMKLQLRQVLLLALIAVVQVVQGDTDYTVHQGITQLLRKVSGYKTNDEKTEEQKKLDTRKRKESTRLIKRIRC